MALRDVGQFATPQRFTTPEVSSMGRMSRGGVEFLRLAEQVVEAAENARELRCNLAVFLSKRLGLTLEQTGGANGEWPSDGHGPLVRSQTEFRGRAGGPHRAR